MEALWNAFWSLSVDMGVYILFGLLAAGVLHQLVRESSVRKHLGASSHGSVYKAALVGTPLPLCSCSVIPFAASLRKSGASRGATMSFLISTPITGVDSILATFGMFGGAFTLYRVVSSVAIAIAAGMLMNRFEPEERTAAPRFGLNPQAPVNPVGFAASSSAEAPRVSFSVKQIFGYGFGTLLGSFAKPLLWGLVIGAFISAALPPDYLHRFGESRVWGYLIAVGIAAPMYVCATASLPVAASLIIAGVSPGAAFVFLSAGPATNTVTMGVVKSMLGSRALVIYLLTIILGSVGFGVMIDQVFDLLSVRLPLGNHEHPGIFDQAAAALLLGLIGYHLITAYVVKHSQGSCSGGSCCS